MSSDRIFRFTRHHETDAYTQAGWIDRGPAPGSHGHWSRVMEWTREDPPKEPQREEEGV